MAKQFLDPMQARTPDNPFWIYPLDTLEIKCEIAGYATNNTLKGIRAHFMNLDINVLNNDSGGYQTSKYNK